MVGIPSLRTLPDPPGFGIELNEDALRAVEHTRSGIGVFTGSAA